MNRLSNAKRWLLGIAVALGALVLFFVMDAPGNLSLYRWQVRGMVRVLDASTGTPIQDPRISYAFSFGETPLYERAKPVTGGADTAFGISMMNCRGEGGLFDRFREPARPVPSMYRIEISAPGYLPQRIEASTGELVEDPRQPPSNDRFSLRLPEVRLEPIKN